MVDKEEMTKTPSPLNINEAIEGEVLNQKTARSKYQRKREYDVLKKFCYPPFDLNLKTINSRLFMSLV